MPRMPLNNHISFFAILLPNGKKIRIRSINKDLSMSRKILILFVAYPNENSNCRTLLFEILLLINISLLFRYIANGGCCSFCLCLLLEDQINW